MSQAYTQHIPAIRERITRIDPWPNFAEEMDKARRIFEKTLIPSNFGEMSRDWNHFAVPGLYCRLSDGSSFIKPKEFRVVWQIPPYKKAKKLRDRPHILPFNFRELKATWTYLFSHPAPPAPENKVEENWDAFQEALWEEDRFLT